MKGINKVILVGNVGKDPEMKYTASGKAIANLTVATSESWNDKQTGEKVDKTEWHKIVAFDRLAEIMGEYVKKGGQVYIEGKLQTRKWQDKEGKDHYSTEIIASQMQMIGSKPVDDKPKAEGFRKPQTEPQSDFVDDDVPW